MRSAREPCHKRKVRCIVSTEGGPCDCCQSRKLSCLFLPRYESGRQPIGNHNLGLESSNTPSPNQNSDESHLSSVQVEPMKQKAVQVNKKDQNDIFDWNWVSTARQFYPRPEPTTLSDLDMTVLGNHTANDFSLHNSVVEGDGSDMANGDHQNMRHIEPSTSLALKVPNCIESAASQDSSERNSTSDKALGQKDFSKLLEYCRKLQYHIARIPDDVSFSLSGQSITTAGLRSAISTMQLQEMLGDVDTSCNFIFSIYGQGVLFEPVAKLEVDLDHASVLLTNALILKVFQVCDTVFSCRLLKNHGLDDVLLHKRLDFNINTGKNCYVEDSGTDAGRTPSLKAYHDDRLVCGREIQVDQLAQTQLPKYRGLTI